MHHSFPSRLLLSLHILLNVIDSNLIDHQDVHVIISPCTQNALVAPVVLLILTSLHIHPFMLDCRYCRRLFPGFAPVCVLEPITASVRLSRLLRTLLDHGS